MKNIIFKAPSKNIKKDENLLNLIPCIIHHTGKANVNEYFNHKVQTLKGISLFGYRFDFLFFNKMEERKTQKLS